MATEKNIGGGFTTIRYMKKEAIQPLHSDESMSPQAKEVINSAKAGDILVLRISVNSPAYIEKALPLTPDNIRAIVE
ncbi:MAG: hypothetical protein AB1529_04965 [Candidatus Micrarchaeota archaeon]